MVYATKRRWLIHWISVAGVENIFHNSLFFFVIFFFFPPFPYHLGILINYVPSTQPSCKANYWSSLIKLFCCFFSRHGINKQPPREGRNSWSGRNLTARCPDNVDAVRDSVGRSPKNSPRRSSQELSPSRALWDKVNQFLPLSPRLTSLKWCDCFLRLRWRMNWWNMNYHIVGLHLFWHTVYTKTYQPTWMYLFVCSSHTHTHTHTYIYIYILIMPFLIFMKKACSTSVYIHRS